jgi:hypothetical protein
MAERDFQRDDRRAAGVSHLEGASCAPACRVCAILAPASAAPQCLRPVPLLARVSPGIDCEGVREALQAVFRAEKKAYAFFTDALRRIPGGDVKVLFEELRQEEIEHERLVLAAL